MSIRKTTMIECDNPRCSSEYEHTKEDPAPGYHLKGYWVLAGGGPIPATYACSQPCVGAAVEHIIAESLKNE